MRLELCIALRRLWLPAGVTPKMLPTQTTPAVPSGRPWGGRTVLHNRKVTTNKGTAVGTRQQRKLWSSGRAGKGVGGSIPTKISDYWHLFSAHAAPRRPAGEGRAGGFTPTSMPSTAPWGSDPPREPELCTPLPPSASGLTHPKGFPQRNQQLLL